MSRSAYNAPETTHTLNGFVEHVENIRATARTEQARFDFLGDSSQIFYAGDLELLQSPCVAIIGTRKASEDGLRRARKLARLLVRNGIVVVSGLAAGIDTAAHTAALEEGGSTIAVIGTPLDRAYPANNKRLQEQIYREHLLLSPFVQGQRTYPSDFPKRNRVMALVSDASVIIEASETSGTIHQAKECQRLGRPVFFTRSLVDSGIEWPHSFLEKYPKAHVLETIDDLLSVVQA